MSSPDSTEVADALREIADEIEKSDIRSWHVHINSGTVAEDMPNLSVNHYYNGDMDVEINISYYSKERDQRSKYVEDLKEHDSQRT